MTTRQAMWDRLGEPVDVLVVGGGINGAGIARDASMRGLSVAVVEMHDLAYGTSSRSSKLVHGGLRYLEQYEFSLVFESVSERRILLDIAPHLVKPMGFLFPVYKGSRQPLWLINTGMWLYDGLSLFRSPKIHRKLSPKEVASLEPTLLPNDLVGAPLFYDCATDDARLTLETALDAVQRGAVVCPRAKVVGLLKDEGGHVVGATVSDAHTGERKEVRAGVVVLAAGPWIDSVLALETAGQAPVLRPTKGVHIVFDRHRLPVQHTVVCLHPQDGRVLFTIPWGDRTYLGTTDTDYQGDPGDVAATSDDIDYLLAAVQAYFPDAGLARDDVISTWAGLRPLLRPPEGRSESETSREHVVRVDASGVVSVAGGKLTTFRRMSAEVVDTAVQVLRLSGRTKEPLGRPPTEREVLPGAVGWPEDDKIDGLVAQVAKAANGTLDDDIARHLVGTYGMRAVDVARRVAADPLLGVRLVPDRHEILAQVDHAVFAELASEVDDVMTRRTQLYFRDHDQGLGCVDAVADRMAHLLAWDSDRRAASVAAYRGEVSRSRRWKDEASA